MSRSLRAALVAALSTFALVLVPSAAGAATTLERPSPSWYTPALHAQVLAAGADGVQVSQEELNLWCPGYQAPGVSAGGCIVDPYGCTANFVFTDGSRPYIGTARHCVDGVGDTVVMQVDTTTLAAVGTVVRHTGGEGEPGEDFALIEIDPAVAAKWGVNPAIPFTGGPQGVYDGCSVESVSHYGHGYGVTVAQGKPETGVATNWLRDGYGWTGFGFPGDSGSPVVLTADKRAAGNFTHLIVDTRDYFGSNLAGMRATAILAFLGGGYQLVNADGSTSSGPSTWCTTGGGSGSGGNGDGKTKEQDGNRSDKGQKKGSGNGKGPKKA